MNPFSENCFVDNKTLEKDIFTIITAMDELVDENINNHPLQIQRDIARKYRNIGMGVMGLADMLVKMKLTYGSDEAIQFTKDLMNFIFKSAVHASVQLAKEKGSFPGYKSCVWDSSIMKENFSKEELEILKKMDCLRNCSLLSIAPTGSIGTMLNVSTGCEPFFQLEYTRRTESLNKEESYYKVYIKALQEYRDITGNTDIPSYFVTSSDIHWKGRVAMQSALQRACDTAISSTINLPKGTTPETIENIYFEAWLQRLKGVTVYVDGSRQAILSTEKPPTVIEGRQAPKRPKELEADYYETKVKGEQFIVIVGLLDGKPYEIFTIRPQGITVNNGQHKGKVIKMNKMHYKFISDKIQIDNLKTSEENVEEMAATLYSSMLLRHGVHIDYIIKTAKKVNENITSFSSAMCRILAKYTSKHVVEGVVCPECGGKIIKEGGCDHCETCGYSKCG